MPLSKLQFRPGINKESTTYANEGGWYDSEKVRWRSGFPEKIGGWVNLATKTSGVVNTFKGVARNLWNWITLNTSNLNAVGTNQKIYVENGGKYYDITPLTAASPVTLANNPITTVNGSALVTIAATAHGATAGTYVTFSGATASGGLTIVGEFEIITVVDGNTFTIISPTVATSSATGGGASVVANYQISAGNAIYVAGNGWGAGGWGRGGWGSGTDTSAGAGDQLRIWSMDNYGQDLVLDPRNGSIYYWATDTASYPRAVTVKSLSTSAGYAGTFVPHTVYQIMTSDIQRFGVAFGANPYDPTNANTAFDPMLVRWSDQENIYDWVPTSINQSGELRLSSGSMIIAGLHTRQENLIFTDSALFSMQYVGPPYVWGFSMLTDNISIMGPNAFSTVNGITYWMGVDKFYSYSGRTETLPCTVRQYVFNDINLSQSYLVTSGTNEGYSEIWWHYPSANSFVNDRYVIFNHLERIWYVGTMSRTAWLDSPLRGFPMASFSVQNSYLSTAITSSSVTIALINGASYPTAGTIQIDSEIITYTGNNANALTGCIRGTNGTTAASHIQYAPVTYYVPNQVMYHEDGVDDYSGLTPAAIDSYVQSSDFDIGDGHNFGFVWRILPDVTFAGSTAASPALTMVIQPRVNSGTAYGTPNPNTVTRTSSYPVEQYTGQVYTRLRGRQMAFKIESTALGVAWQLGSPRIDIRPDGKR
jgi:hypothetical protein